MVSYCQVKSKGTEMNTYIEYETKCDRCKAIVFYSADEYSTVSSDVDIYSGRCKNCLAFLCESCIELPYHADEHCRADCEESTEGACYDCD